MTESLLQYCNDECTTRCKASLPGAELFLKNTFFFEQATCPGQLRCLGQNFFSKIRFFEQATCPGQLRCLGQNVFSEFGPFLNKPLVPGSFAAWGRTFFSKKYIVLNKPLVPGSFAAWGRTVSQKSDFFEQATCPRQLRCLGQIFFSKSDTF